MSSNNFFLHQNLKAQQTYFLSLSMFLTNMTHQQKGGLNSCQRLCHELTMNETQAECNLTVVKAKLVLQFYLNFVTERRIPVVWQFLTPLTSSQHPATTYPFSHQVLFLYKFSVSCVMDSSTKTGPEAKHLFQFNSKVFYC